MTTTETAATTGHALVDADPNELDIADNVRDEVVFGDDDPFVDSIRQHGVLQAISAVRRADGTLAVIDGQRRTLAARAVELPRVPVVVRPQSAEEKTATIERIVAQLTHNEHRTDFTERQRARGVTELIDLGMTVPAVAKALRFRQDYTEVAAVAGRSKNARRNFDELQLSLEHAATVAELEEAAERDPLITDELDAVLSQSWGIDWKLRTLVRKIADRAALRDAAAEHLARGFGFLAEEPSTLAGEWFTLTDLRTEAGDPLLADTAERAPHLWDVHVTDAGTILVDAETGEEVDETLVDPDTFHDDANEVDAEDGLRHANTVTEQQVWTFEYFITNAHRVEAGLATKPDMVALVDDGGDDDLTPSQRQAAREQAEHVERQRAERRKVKALNRAGATATELRRTFLTGILAGKTPPKNATRWMIGILSAHGDVFTESKSADRYADIMKTPLASAADKADKASAARAEVLLLARVLTAFEARLTGPQDSKDYWRFSSKHYRGMVGIDSYLTFLADAGHALTPVEQAAIGNMSIDAAYKAVSDD